MQIGDKVKIKNVLTIKISGMKLKDYNGMTGIIKSNEKRESCYKKQSYWVQLTDFTTQWFCYNELEVINHANNRI